MERNFEIATRMRGDAWRWPVSEERLLTVQCESSKNLEGDCGMDKVPQCHPLKPFQEGTHNKLLAQEKI